MLFDFNKQFLFLVSVRKCTITHQQLRRGVIWLYCVIYIHKYMLYDSFWKRPTTSNHAHSN